MVASGLIYLPSHARDFKNPDIDKYLARYVRGSNGIDYKERIKIMKLLWDAIGSEFGARHELYEMNYSGSHEVIRVFQLQQAKANGTLKAMEALADRCMADYDEDGWRNPAYHVRSDISVLDEKAICLGEKESAEYCGDGKSWTFASRRTRSRFATTFARS